MMGEKFIASGIWVEINNIFQIGPKKKMIHYEKKLLSASNILLLVPEKEHEGF